MRFLCRQEPQGQTRSCAFGDELCLGQVSLPNFCSLQSHSSYRGCHLKDPRSPFQLEMVLGGEGLPMSFSEAEMALGRECLE